MINQLRTSICQHLGIRGSYQEGPFITVIRFVIMVTGKFVVVKFIQKIKCLRWK